MKPVCIDKTVFVKAQKLYCGENLCSRIIMTRIRSVPKNVQTGSGTTWHPVQMIPVFFTESKAVGA